MNLWLLTVGVFFFGWVLVALRGRSRQDHLVRRTSIDLAVVYVTYTLAVGMLVAFNLFVLGRIDPLFESTRWHIFRVLYWPSWILTFALMLIGGVLVVVAAGFRGSRRILAFALLLALTLTTLEIVFLSGLNVMATALVQTLAFALYAVGVFAAYRSKQETE